MSRRVSRWWPGRPGVRSLALCTAACAVLAAWGCLQPEPATTSGGRLSAGEPADNAVCLICHMDFKAEVLSVVHVKAGVGCAACHGQSLAHGDDEVNITTPDKLFGRAEIDPFCKTCHPTHKTGDIYDAFVKKWHGKRRPNGRMILDDAVCTDCHGNPAALRLAQQEAIQP